ncbi:MAG: phosphate regulon transcriptional regulatory protein PhoB [Candidatus Marinimicrobia bacterium]|nr:phosphate regulon transcriptional regulatory protein PhoB [Candidatus Neomarinimicrobiota bacterium]
MKPNVLIVEDEVSLMTMLRYNLEKEGFVVAEARDGEEALIASDESPPDAIILDWMLPRISGLEVCRQLRRKEATRSVPIIILTARSEERDKVRGLNVGADDYMVKPFSMPELVARLQALLRRSNRSQSKGRLTFDDIELDMDTYRVSRGGEYIHLGPTEFRLLRYLMARPGFVFSREELLNGVWGADIYVEPRTVDVHIRRLRKALNGQGSPDVIRTVRAAGYAIDKGAH